jgi:transposase
MPAPYSYDLRIKVIEAIDRGMGKTQASKIFNISRNTINLSLNRRKKTYGYRERDEEIRKAFSLKISQKEAKDRVYVDESGIDNREDYGYGWNEKGQRYHD